MGLTLMAVLLHCRGAGCGGFTFLGDILAIFSAISYPYKRDISGDPFSFLCTVDPELSEKDAVVESKDGVNLKKTVKNILFFSYEHSNIDVKIITSNGVGNNQ